MANSEKQRETRHFAHYVEKTEKRPYKKENRTSAAHIGINVPPAEHDHLQALAAAAQQDMRSYIATAINQYAKQTVIAPTMGRGNRTPRKPAAQPESDAE